MKSVKLYIFAIAALYICGVWAQTNEETVSDTLLKVDKPSKLVITENSDGSIITVTGIKENDSFNATVKTEYPKNSSVSSNQSVKPAGSVQLPGMEKSGKGWFGYVDGMTIGLSNPAGLGPDKGLQWSKSIEIGWLDCIAVGYSWGKTALSLGIGFDWRNYKITTSDRYLTVTPAKGIEWADANTLPEGSKLKNSRLKVFSLQLPLLLRVKIPNSSLRLKVGPIFNFNTHASLKTNYIDMSGGSNELFTEDLNQRRFTLDFFGNLSVSSWVGIFVRYSPMKVMDAADGLNFRPLTIGLTIGI